jgi:hypothetical protein
MAYALRRIEQHAAQAVRAFDAVDLDEMLTALARVDEELKALRAYVDGAPGREDVG